MEEQDQKQMRTEDEGRIEKPPLDPTFPEDIGAYANVPTQERLEDLDEELAQQYEHLEEYADVPDAYECKHGHRTHGEFRYRAVNAATGDLEADSGPMCRVCMLKAIGSKFRAKLVPLKVRRN